jgi:hypothetical protein
MEDEKYQEVFDEGARFNASMITVSVVIITLIVLGAYIAWCCGGWICALVGRLI